jgi:hypothetical protein
MQSKALFCILDSDLNTAAPVVVIEGWLLLIAVNHFYVLWFMTFNLTEALKHNQ